MKTLTEFELHEKRAGLFRGMEDANQKKDGVLFDSLKKEMDAVNSELYMRRLETLNQPEFDDGEPVREINFGKRSQTSPDLARAILKAAKSGFTEGRGITSTTGSGALQDPIVREDYFAAAMAKHDFFAKTGIPVKNVPNYSQWPIFGDPAPTWQAAEGDQVSESSMTITSKKIEMKTCAILVKLSKQLVRDGGDLVERMINDALLKAFADELGRVVLRGNGTTEPLGIDGTDDVEEYSVSGDLITNWTPHLRILKQVHENGAVPDNCSWIAGSNGMLQIESLDDSTGQYLQKPPVLTSMPYVYSSHVGETYDTNKTRVYLGDMSNVIVGVAGPYILPLREKYADYLQDAFILFAGVDTLVRRPAEIGIIKNIGLMS